MAAVDIKITPSARLERCTFIFVVHLLPSKISAEICRREELSVGELCQRIDERRRESTLTAALRVYVLNYFKAAATECGHASAGHGTFSTKSGR